MSMRPGPRSAAVFGDEDDVARPVDQRADGFQAVRDARRSELVEDYVELIAELDAEAGEARPVEIAARMGVTQPTVAKNLGRLKREGFITHEPYRSVFLTDAGKALAERCRTRHQIVVRFLVSLGVDEPTAEQDAEGIEHHVSDRTLAAFEGFIADQANRTEAPRAARDRD